MQGHLIMLYKDLTDFDLTFYDCYKNDQMSPLLCWPLQAPLWSWSLFVMSATGAMWVAIYRWSGRTSPWKVETWEGWGESCVCLLIICQGRDNFIENQIWWFYLDNKIVLITAHKMKIQVSNKPMKRGTSLLQRRSDYQEIIVPTL